ncbi:nitrite reductase small subunit NirD [Microbulbifer yueqingensis]|uniref:Nitrite reductase (NADH) small subunit n=1 Tax=Microbulbifer yueqingensis TaxID=658219 RepID=A0A1G8XM87_9GAMM|nr:nitrite reductase small subunit NirD [Microbulbifer yueqingensis]SDJ91658.1 nitrite reductase (NADH) small subunit [Microbulbifer yueqingensis]
MNQVAINPAPWQPVCQRSDLVANSGVCALMGDPSATGPLAGRRSIALFFIPHATPQFYAIDNWDPIAGAGVIARGLVAEIDGELTVASPLYKHHFRLRDGACLEDSNVCLRTYPVALDGDCVSVALAPDRQ